ncbi:hypothetical protein BD289DRAFT_438510 [Coniella lustricola]|uniref:Hemerythrin-like domain-containing protein n=1 Tax=Coniella lustricola TaxID=2025994 RepID=A0A2T3A2Z2_9PEZI|nr:hypothetical protein BD289DRAFT_438510 [Coniella lustricola]
MTPQYALAPWADEPFKLIETLSQRAELATEKHSYVHVATEMVHVHNVLIRGINAIVQQAPYVKDSTQPSYKEKDVRDLLSYVSSWCKMVDHHHSTEESFIFPEIEKVCGKSMESPRQQHKEFHGGLESLLAYAEATKPREYRWTGPAGMKEIIDSFSQSMIHHLYDEIGVLLTLKDVNSDALRKAWDEGERIATASGNIGLLVSATILHDTHGRILREKQYTVFPCVLGNADKTYKGAETFPPLPKVLLYLVKYIFGARNGAWRFNPCDFWGQPRPLAFGPGQ